MYICICNAVTDHEIEDAVREGARTLAELQKTLLVSTGCGKCREAVRQCLDRYLAEKPHRKPTHGNENNSPSPL